jgi:hypothetical protein
MAAVNDLLLETRDALETQGESLSIQANQTSHFIVIDMPIDRKGV